MMLGPGQLANLVRQRLLTMATEVPDQFGVPVSHAVERSQRPGLPESQSSYLPGVNVANRGAIVKQITGKGSVLARNQRKFTLSKYSP